MNVLIGQRLTLRPIVKKDLEKLNIKYILSKEDFNEKSFKDEFEEVYNEDGMYIYIVK